MRRISFRVPENVVEEMRRLVSQGDFPSMSYLVREAIIHALKKKGLRWSYEQWVGEGNWE